MKLTDEELHLCYQSLYFEVMQVTNDLTEHVIDYEDEILLLNKLYNNVEDLWNVNRAILAKKYVANV